MAMVAYDALFSLAQTIEQIIFFNHCPVSPQQKKELTCAMEHVNLLLLFLENNAGKASSLEGRIIKVATDAEVIIGVFMSELISLRHELPKVHSKRKFIRELKEVTNGIAAIAGDVMDVEKSLEKVVSLPAISDAASSSSRLAASREDGVVVGFDDDLMAMKERVCGEPYNLQVLPILGMGGIGKTTLARHVYNDKLIMETFDIRAWVTVSQDYSVKEFFSGLVVSLQHLIDAKEGKEKEDDGVRVYKALKGRRYIIVMDDMWSTEVWDDVRRMFPDDVNGSRILLTTRLADVAAYPDPRSHLHKMHFIDADNSWDLLQKKVFNQQPCPPELEKIGKEIARSCRGLPLAVVVIAGLLSTASNNRALWEEIAVNVTSAGNSEQGQIEEILALSYSQLPHHLKLCFLYMASFPEDHQIHASNLIKLWVAEGFCRSQTGSKSLEEAGEECLEDLVKRSLVLVQGRKYNGKIRSLSMHDLMRDLCIRKAREEKFLVHLNDRYVGESSLESITNQRRIIIMSNRESTPLEDYGWFRGSSVRTLMFFEPQETETLIFCAQSSLLKVLNVFKRRPERCFSLPHQTCELLHLRYFAFPVSKIPDSISNLQNLQTLIIPEAYGNPQSSIRLPKEIWSISKLRHIQIYACVLPSAEGETSVSENLQTLSTTLNLVCTKQILDRIPNVRRLRLLYSDGYYNGDWHLEYLEKLHQLQSLTVELRVYIQSGLHSVSLREMLNPVFPASLRKLTLKAGGFHLEEYFVLSPAGLTNVASLPNLEVLNLSYFSFQDGKWETNEGGFVQLKILVIVNTNLKHWITEASHFLKLESLRLCRCPELRELPEDIGDIPTLELIELFVADKRLVDSAERILKEQQSYGNEDLRVRILSWA